MNKKAQMDNLGMIMTIFITVLVGVVLFQTVAQEAGTGSAEATVTNASVTAVAAGTNVDMDGQELLDTPVVTNSSGQLQTVTVDYVIDEGVSATTGVKTVQYRGVSGNASSQAMNVTYTYGVDGYIDSSGGRAMASLIAVFFALAIAVVALTPTLRSGLLERMGR